MTLRELKQLAEGFHINVESGRKLVSLRQRNQPNNLIYINRLDSENWTFQFQGETVIGKKFDCILGAIFRLTKSR